MSETEITVEELMRAFLDGLCSLIPVFEKAKLGWKQEDAYDPWDNTASTLFDSLIKSAVDSGSYNPKIFPLINYDAWVSSYFNKSYITEAGTNGLTAFICFENNDHTFDGCRFAKLRDTGEVLETYSKKISQIEFSFVPRCQDGSLMEELKILKFKN